MSRLDPELAAALQVLECAFGRLQILDVHSTLPERRPAPAPATAGPDQRGLFDPGPVGLLLFLGLIALLKR